MQRQLQMKIAKKDRHGRPFSMGELLLNGAEATICWLIFFNVLTLDSSKNLATLTAGEDGYIEGEWMY